MSRMNTEVIEVGDWVTVDTSTWDRQSKEHRELWEGTIAQVMAIHDMGHNSIMCRTIYPLSDHPQRGGPDGQFAINSRSVKLFMKKRDLLLDRP